MTDPDLGTPDRQPAADLLADLYGELRRLAGALVGRLQPGQTLQPTALVHEAYLRLVRADDPGWEGRRHFFGAAARAMREILIEQARSKGRLKRGGDGKRVAFDDALAAIHPPADDVLAVDEAITRLRAEDPDLAEMVTLRFFGGLSLEETAGVLGKSVSTLTREWRFARAWLARQLGDGVMAAEG
jgi:RNA polymerase sigma factor (TIGR02999 family)